MASSANSTQPTAPTTAMVDRVAERDANDAEHGAGDHRPGEQGAGAGRVVVGGQFDDGGGQAQAESQHGQHQAGHGDADDLADD